MCVCVGRGTECDKESNRNSRPEHYEDELGKYKILLHFLEERC